MKLVDLFKTTLLTQKFELWFDGKKVQDITTLADTPVLHPTNPVNMNFKSEIKGIYTQCWKFGKRYQPVLVIEMKEWKI